MRLQLELGGGLELIAAGKKKMHECEIDEAKAAGRKVRGRGAAGRGRTAPSGRPRRARERE